MEKPKYRTAFVTIVVFIISSIVLYALLSNVGFQVMGLPVSLFLLWLLQPAVAIIAIIFSKKVFNFSK